MLFIISASFLIHISFFGGVAVLKQIPAKKTVAVSMKIVEKPKEKPPVQKIPKKKKKPKRPKKVQQKRTPKKKPKKNAKKIQGLSKEALVTDSTVSAPAGNTLMKRDEGIRLTPDEIDALEKDLSSDALLVQGSFQLPEYTQAALDADLEGKYIIDVYVDAEGDVLQADFNKKIGYGMDERAKNMALSSKFIPRKNAKGVPMAGWAEIRFYMSIP